MHACSWRRNRGASNRESFNSVRGSVKVSRSSPASKPTSESSSRTGCSSMIDAIVTTCLKRRAIVWLVFVLVAMYGLYCWTQLPLEAYPDIADTTSQVVTQVPGLAAEEVEKQITIPLEREIMGTPGM